MVAIALLPGFRILRWDGKRVVAGGDPLPDGLLDYLRSDAVEMGPTGCIGENGAIATILQNPRAIASDGDLWDALQYNKMGYKYDGPMWVPYEPDWLELS